MWKGFKLTKTAEKQMIILINKNPEVKGLCLSIKKSGCAGFKYIMNLTKNPSSEDLKFSFKNVTLFVPVQAMPFIDGTEIDYIYDGLNQNFKFQNPKAQHSCGCGESFSIE
ncbi:Fe-S cluster assembly scaffold SufA [Candidatus Pantoea edessiphila]|uniref:Fe-S cluster assembly scaffold SufA n=1 Tax=Candidatus Pantoea edessiphila TaxID=2044610 RepID=A0A2P5SZ30_9GAMM|nr:iron-sulfur cluster assembly accessory protein [Candidatus Pantoea edessiphila]MBK4775385.1 iron-sulfur cluster assembly accessory protein [Pantoea sp. Edef]PPI87607.1 Fe-S cluster assembly scaffold SufA [Candidatus Pantoea edessiphila]